MKIIKKITACEDTMNVSMSSREKARMNIKNAIECLAQVAESDIVAKESIANLAVVMIDLQEN